MHIRHGVANIASSSENTQLFLAVRPLVLRMRFPDATGTFWKFKSANWNQVSSALLVCELARRAKCDLDLAWCQGT